MKKDSKNSTSWEPVAGWYDGLLTGDDTYQTKVILPNLMRLLPPTFVHEGSGEAKQGKKIIDIACGQGFFSKAYADAGADVFGVDISPNLIAIAEKNRKDNLRFEVTPASKMPSVTSNTFDGAMIVLALQNIKEMNETLKEASRVLVKEGTLVIVLNHPFLRIPKVTSWGFDEKNNVQYRRVDKYGTAFSTEVDMNPGGKAEEKVQTISFHRPLQDYFKSLSSAGFSVIGLEEWISHKKSEAGPRAMAEDTARKEFPMFVTIVARKS